MDSQYNTSARYITYENVIAVFGMCVHFNGVFHEQNFLF